MKQFGFAVIFMLIVIFAILFFLGRNLRLWMASFKNMRKIGGRLFWPLYIGITIFLMMSGLLLTGRPWKFIKTAGNYFLAFLLYMIFLTIIADVVVLLVRYLLQKKEKWEMVKFRVVRVAGAAAVAIAVLIVSAGAWTASHSKVTEYTISRSTPGKGENLNIVLLSDTHIGNILGYDYVESMVKRINSMDADLVCFAGDFFESDFAMDNPDGILMLLRSIQSKHGVFACLGNHDRGSHADEMRAFLKDANITLLEDSYCEIDGRFIIAGRADKSSELLQGKTTVPVAELLSGADLSLPVILLDHQPSRLEEAAEAGVDLLLCGHTHAGQLFPVTLIVDAIYENAYGYLEKQGMPIIVSSGYGTWGPPVRVGSVSEIVKISIDI